MKRKYLIRPVLEGAQEPQPPVLSKSRQEMIAEAAYYRAERRGFSGGSAEQDWLAAEVEIEAMMNPFRGERR